MAHPLCQISILGSERQVGNHHQQVECPPDAWYCTEYLKITFRGRFQNGIPSVLSLS